MSFATLSGVWIRLAPGMTYEGFQFKLAILDRSDEP